MKTINKKTTIMTSITIATLLITGSSYMGMQNVFAGVADPWADTVVSAGYFGNPGEPLVMGAVAAAPFILGPDDNKFIQLSLGNSTVVTFDDNLAYKDCDSTGDLRIHTYDEPFPANATVSVSNDGSTWIEVATDVPDWDPNNYVDLDLDGVLDSGVSSIQYVNITTTYDIAPPLGFDLDAIEALNLEETSCAEVEAEKTWTHTDYNWDPVCRGYYNATSVQCEVSEQDNTPLDLSPANINGDIFPFETVLADELQIDANGNYTAFAQVHKNKFKNTNPGAFYALTTVNVTSSLDSLTVDELYDECTGGEQSGNGILQFVSKKDTRNVKVAVANSTGFVTELTDDLYYEIGGNITASLDNATVNITNSTYLEEGSTVYVLVKFQDNLRDPTGIIEEMCTNFEDVTARTLDDSNTVSVNATLRISSDPDFKP
jgi:hypothetical protein